MLYTHGIDLAFKIANLFFAAFVLTLLWFGTAKRFPRVTEWLRSRTVLARWTGIVGVGTLAIAYYLTIYHPFMDVVTTGLYVREKFGVSADWGQSRQLRTLFCAHLQDNKWYPMDEVLRLPADQRLAALLKAARRISGKYGPNDFAATPVPPPGADAPGSLRKQAEAGDPAAQYRLAVQLERGIGGSPDIAGAMGWYRKAAEQGNPGSMDALGRLYADKRSDGVDLSVSAEWYAREADTRGCSYCVVYAVEGAGADDAAWDDLQAAADGGDAAAQNRLGVRYEKGAGVARDLAQARAWYRKAADQGLVEAQWNLGRIAAAREEKAAWYRKAAEQGDVHAQNALGLLYVSGDGFPRNPAEAAAWFRRAADQGDAEGENNLGTCHEQGTGVPKDPGEALRLFQEAAGKGEATAELNLGRIYAKGWGVDRDLAQAAAWYQKGADQGDGPSAYYLARSYETGDGMGKDLDAARQWYGKAAERANPEAAAKKKAFDAEAPPPAVPAS